ncbi:MAG: Rieske 2Fe-2S domain-containing protein [Leptospiraceae bacterium]|nr:Rieske 2Fe-2S domain-containing protein [Leptospiraceae bacterium]MDW8306927.1 Rieske 2Fe-2S domain-containing protein [Leptospiraceae bacterium]
MYRRDFLRQAAGATLTLFVPVSFFSCASDEEEGENLSGNLTLTPEQKAELDEQGFINLNGVIVLRVGNEYRAFGRRCPHQGGEVKAISSTQMQCQRHKDQYYNDQGQGNGARTTQSLVRYEVVVNSEGKVVVQS